MDCPSCGFAVAPPRRICPQCATLVTPALAPVIQAEPEPIDAPSIIFALMGFLIPLAGLFLWLYFRADYPKKAASAAKGSMTGVAATVVLLFALYTFLFVAVRHGHGGLVPPPIRNSVAG